MVDSIKNFLTFANEFADMSGKILKKKFDSTFSVSSKIDGSFVTDVDIEIEKLFLDNVKKKFPNHGVIGEEFGIHNEGSENMWVIDPLDGTHSFIAGKPLFGTLICLINKNRPSLGLLDMPILKERWYGGKNLGVKKNNVVCRLSDNKKKLNEVILSSTSLMMFDDKHLNVIKDIYKKVRFPIFGTDCYAYGLFLSGKVDMIIEANLKPWDYMAQVSLINEIGGIATDWSGKPLSLRSDGKVLISRSKESYLSVLNKLSKINDY